MIRNFDPQTIGLSLAVSLGVAFVVVGVRLWLMQRHKRARQIEARQLTERLRALLGVCRALGGSFSPAGPGDVRLIEEALAELLLFGSLPQVRLAAQAAQQLASTGRADCQELVTQLRGELREQLGLEALPADLALPPAGPGRANQRGGGGGGGGGGRRGIALDDGG
jgi:hypothetical protein